MTKHNTLFYRKLRKKAQNLISLKELNAVFPWKRIRLLLKFPFCHRLSTNVKFLLWLSVVAIINFVVFSYSYWCHSTDFPRQDVQPVTVVPDNPSLPPLLHKKHLKNTVITMDLCSKNFSWPAWENRRVTELMPPVKADCDKLWKGSESEIELVKKRLENWENIVLDNVFIRDYLTDCEMMQQDFMNFYTSEEEKQFPIAYLMNVHTDLQQIVRFLKVIYRPHNAYCIHVDKKSTPTFHKGMAALVKCLPNIQLAKNTYDVLYETIDQVDALRSCYSELVHSDIKWKYALNLCGRELPLMTNREIVKLLKDMKGANVVNPGIYIQDSHVNFDIRRRVLHRIKRTPITHFTTEPLGPVPHDIPVYKNTTFAALMPKFVDFLLKNHKANDFYHFLRDTKYPDEQYFTSLNRLPEAPGGYHLLVKHNLLETLPQVSIAYWTSAASFNLLPHQLFNTLYPNARCRGGYSIHSVCVVGVTDLPHLAIDREQLNAMFFNKYIPDQDHVVMDCMEQDLLNRNRKEFLLDCSKHKS